MARKWFRVEQIVPLLREAEVTLVKGQSMSNGVQTARFIGQDLLPPLGLARDAIKPKSPTDLQNRVKV